MLHEIFIFVYFKVPLLLAACFPLHIWDSILIFHLWRSFNTIEFACLGPYNNIDFVLPLHGVSLVMDGRAGKIA